MKRVVLESPFAGHDPDLGVRAAETSRNMEYARMCMADCLRRNEAPFASHLLYTQMGILDDQNPAERKLGMRAGFAWGDLGDLVVVYTDLGISDGMREGIERANKYGRTVERRALGSKWLHGDGARFWENEIAEIRRESASGRVAS